MLLTTIIYRILQKDIWKINHIFPVLLTFVLGTKGKIQGQLHWLKPKNNWINVELSPFTASRVRRSCKQLWILLWGGFHGAKKKRVTRRQGKKTVPCKPKEMHIFFPFCSAHLKSSMFHFFKKEEMSVAVSPRWDLWAPGWHFKTEDVIKICVFARYWHSNFTRWFSFQYKVHQYISLSVK